MVGRGMIRYILDQRERPKKKLPPHAQYDCTIVNDQGAMATDH